MRIVDTIKEVTKTVCDYAVKMIKKAAKYVKEKAKFVYDHREEIRQNIITRLVEPIKDFKHTALLYIKNLLLDAADSKYDSAVRNVQMRTGRNGRIDSYITNSYRPSSLYRDFKRGH